MKQWSASTDLQVLAIALKEKMAPRPIEGLYQHLDEAVVDGALARAGVRR